MGFIAYLDALGFKSYYAKGTAQGHLERIQGYAHDSFSVNLPGSESRLCDEISSSVVVLNDSVFMYTEHLENAIWFSSCLARATFWGEGKYMPIGMRGGIAETKKCPKISELNKSKGRFTGKTIVIDNIADAMVIDKSKILGPRVIIPRALVDKEYPRLDLRVQAKIMNVELAYKAKGIGILKHDSKEFYDIAYMLNDTSDESKMRERAKSFWENACHSERASLHASASMALIEANMTRYRGIINALKIIGNGLHKKGLYGRKVHRNVGYQEVMRDYKKIEAIYGKTIVSKP